MNGAEVRYADLGVPVAYREWHGPPGRTFVCAHSLLGSSRDWSDVATAICHLGSVVAIDLPGFGCTPLQDRFARVGTYTEVVSRFVTQMVQGPVILMGTSFGGLVAATVAAEQHPSVGGVVLGSSYLPPYFGGWLAPGVISSLLLEKMSLVGTVMRGRLIRAAMPDLPPAAFTPTGPAPADATSVADRWLAAASLIAEMSVLSAIPHKAERLYDRITCPVLVLHGGEDSLVPVEWAYRSARYRPNWRVETLSAVAHVVKAGPTAWWTRTVEDWISQQGAGGGHTFSDDVSTPNAGPWSARKASTSSTAKGAGTG